MAAERKDPKRRYEELMRNAPKRMRALNCTALKREREARRKQRRRVLKTDERTALELVSQRIGEEIFKLQAKLAAEINRDERILLKAELVKLKELRARFDPRRKRKPPESGMPAPVEPPKGPRPMQGGAAAPLDFGNSRS